MNNKVKVAIGIFLISDIAIAYVGYEMYRNMLKTERNVNSMIASLDKELPKSLKSTNVYTKGFLTSYGEYTISDVKDKSTIKIKYNLDHGIKTLLERKTYVSSSVMLSGKVASVIKPIGTSLMDIKGEVGEDGLVNVAMLSKGFKVENADKRIGEIKVGQSGGKFYHDKSHKLVHDYEFSKIEFVSNNPTGTATFENVGYKIDTPNWRGIIADASFLIGKASYSGAEAKNIKMSYKAINNKGRYDITSKLGVDNVKFKQDEGSFKMSFLYGGLQKEPIDYFNNEILNNKDNYDKLEFKDEYRKQFLTLIQKGFSLSLDTFDLESSSVNFKIKAKIEIHPANSIEDISLEDNVKIVINTEAKGPIVDSMVPLFSGMSGQSPIRYTDGSYKMNAQYEDNKLVVDGVENVNAGLQIRQNLRNLDMALGYDRQLPPLVPVVEEPELMPDYDPELENPNYNPEH